MSCRPTLAGARTFTFTAASTCATPPRLTTAALLAASVLLLAAGGASAAEGGTSHRASPQRGSARSHGARSSDRGHLRHEANAGRRRRRHGGQDSNARVLRSSELWATVDVCMTTAKPMIGIRGSMPGDGNLHDAMFMRFVVQYLQSPGEQWIDLPGSADSGFVRAGSATATRQAGRSFQLAPVQRGQSFRLRGLVEFQWRHGKQVRLTAIRPTTARHRSLAGAIPPGFSAATCTIG